MLRKLIFITSVSLCFGLILQAAETVEGEGRIPMQQMAGQHQMHKITGRADTLQSARDLIGATIQNNNEVTIGTVKELVFDKDTVSCVILLANDTLYPVPWSAFDVSSNTIRLNISKDRFLEAPSMTTIDIRQLGNSAYMQKLESFYSSQISASEKKAAGEKAGLYECSAVWGFKVQNASGQHIGVIKDVVFDVRRGNLAYGLVGFGELLGLEEKTSAVPWNVLTIDSQRRIAMLDAAKTTLESTVIPGNHLNMLARPDFARRIFETYGEKPYWETLGLAAPMGNASSNDPPDDPPPAANPSSTTAPRPTAKYTRHFDASKMTIVEGTIEKVETFKPAINAVPYMKLEIKTTQGKKVTVHLGPDRYMTKQGVKFEPGAAITVTGSKVTFFISPVIMASEIKIEGKTILLRDNQGMPQWPSSKRMKSHQGTTYGEETPEQEQEVYEDMY